MLGAGDCENPQWLAFCREYNDWALGLGANVSLSQTKVKATTHCARGRKPPALPTGCLTPPPFCSARSA